MKNNENHVTVNTLINTLSSVHCPILGSRCLYIYSSRIDEYKNNKGQIILMDGFRSEGFIMLLNITGKDSIKKIRTDIIFDGAMNRIDYLHHIEISPLTAKMFISDLLFTETIFSKKYFVTVSLSTLTNILNGVLSAYKSGTYYK